MRVGYLNMGKTEFMYGLKLVVDSAKTSGFEMIPVAHVGNRDIDVLLVSIYWWEQAYRFVEMMAEAGLDPKKRAPVIIAGGMTPTQNPRPFAPFVNYVFLGEGERAIVPMLERLEGGGDIAGMPGVWTPGQDGTATIQEVPLVVVTGEVVTIKHPVTHIELSRGCPHKCRFCAISHMRRYREAPFSGIKREIHRARTKRINLSAAEKGAHSRLADIQGALARYGKFDGAADIRIEQLVKQEKWDLIRWAMEGVSERLRYGCGKSYTNQKILRWMRQVADMPSRKQDRHRTCNTYIILDLPGETADDYAELRGLLHGATGVLPADFAWKLTPNSFCPQPHTGLQWEAIDIETDHRARWGTTARREDGSKIDYGYTYLANQSLALPPRRILSHLVYRGDERAGMIIWNLMTRKGLKQLTKERTMSATRRLLRLCSKAGISAEWLVGHIAEDAVLPWDCVDNPTTSKESLLRERRSYWKALGESVPAGGAHLA